MYFGNALRLIMFKKKITTIELAKKIGLSQSAVSNILREKRGTKKETFNKIVEVLDLTESERFELKKAYSFDVIDNDILNYFLELEEKNKKLENIVEAIRILKK